jgi:hypothetical protein
MTSQHPHSGQNQNQNQTQTQTQNPLLIYLTGASGSLGSYTLGYLLRHGHQVISTDIAPLRPEIIAEFPEAEGNHSILDLCKISDVDKFFGVDQVGEYEYKARQADSEVEAGASTNSG